MTTDEFFGLLLVGLVAGWLAGLVMKGGGYGIVGDIILGIVGAVIGGFCFSALGVTAYGFLGRVVVATVGAILLVSLVRILGGKPAAAKR